MLPQTIAPDLVQAVLAFTHPRVGGSKAKTLDCVVAVVEMMAEMGTAAGKPFTREAAEEATVFFNITIGPLIEKGRMTWRDLDYAGPQPKPEKNRRWFTLECFSMLGTYAGEEAEKAKSKVITPDHLKAAAARMVAVMEPQCVLPVEGERGLGPDEAERGYRGSQCLWLMTDVRGGQPMVADTVHA